MRILPEVPTEGTGKEQSTRGDCALDGEALGSESAWMRSITLPSYLLVVLVNS